MAEKLVRLAARVQGLSLVEIIASWFTGEHLWN